MSKVRLRIGTYTFALSPKDEMDFALGRSIMKLETMGNPTYQDMGVDEKTLTFSGTLDGNDAWQQAELLESLMDQGLPVTLLYGPVQRTVRLENVNPKLKRLDRVEYDLTLIIIPTKSGYNAPQSPASTVTLPTKAPPATTSTASIKQYLDKTYKVKSGDSLWGIAQRVLGDGSQWNVIAKGNGITNPKALQVGQVLKVPSSTNLPSANTAYSARSTAIVTTAGISYLQGKENAVRFTGGVTLSG